MEFVFKSTNDSDSDSLKQCIYGHRNLLSFRSPYFNHMFTSGMKECKEKLIEVTDVEYDTFRLMVDYLYTGKLSFGVDEKNQHQVVQTTSDINYRLFLQAGRPYGYTSCIYTYMFL